MHGIDYFCTINKIQLRELAEHLGIAQTAINGWKNGTKNFPLKHKQAIYELFMIPEDKYYLLETKFLDAIDRGEIEYIFARSCLENAKEQKLSMVIPKFEIDVRILEQQLKMLRTLEDLKREINSSLSDEDIYYKKLDRVEEVIREIKKY